MKIKGKRILTFILAFVMFSALFANFTQYVSAADKEESTPLESVVTRDDGIWYFPAGENYYKSISDWAGCGNNYGTGTCLLCGLSNNDTNHKRWNDQKHIDSNKKSEQINGHSGIDISMTNKPVYAAAAGKVYYSKKEENYGRGYFAIIEHEIGNGYSYYSYYQHLNHSSEVSIENGTTVEAGQQIATSGNTPYYEPNSAHLHFSIVMYLSGHGERLAKTIVSGNTSDIEKYGLFEIEKKGWILNQPGNYKLIGRINVNPAVSNETNPAYPDTPLLTGSTRAHCGSVHYTFDNKKVSIGAQKNFFTTKSADIRKSPDSSAAIVVTLPKNWAVKFKDKNINKKGETWYKVDCFYKDKIYEKGEFWILAGDVTSGEVCKTHEYNNIGFCKKCGLEYELVKVDSLNTNYIVTTKDNVSIHEKPYSTSKEVRPLKKDEVIKVIESYKNSYGNLWYKLSDGWVYSGYVVLKPEIIISGQTTPPDMHPYGQPFDCRGIIKSNCDIGFVEVGVFDSSGKRVTGDTVKPNVKSYDIINIDPQVKFRELPVGSYTYRINVTVYYPTPAGTVGYTQVFVNKSFSVVLKSGSTSTSSASVVPQAPTGLTAKRESDTTIRVSWNSASDATSYEVDWKNTSTGNWQKSSDYKSGTSYISTGVPQTTAQSYRVRAVNAAGTSPWSEITVPVTPPEAPTGLTAKRESDTTIRVSWNSVSGATSYEVDWKNTSTGNWQKSSDYKSGTSYLSTGVPQTTAQSYRVRAVNAAGTSPWSEITVPAK